MKALGFASFELSSFAYGLLFFWKSFYVSYCIWLWLVLGLSEIVVGVALVSLLFIVKVICLWSLGCRSVEVSFLNYAVKYWCFTFEFFVVMHSEPCFTRLRRFWTKEAFSAWSPVYFSTVEDCFLKVSCDSVLRVLLRHRFYFLSFAFWLSWLM